MSEQLANALAAAVLIGLEALAFLGAAAWAAVSAFHLGATALMTAEGLATLLALAAAWWMYSIAMRARTDS